MQKSLVETLIGVLQWTIATVSVLGTIALITWVAVLFFKKDR